MAYLIENGHRRYGLFYIIDIASYTSTNLKVFKQFYRRLLLHRNNSEINIITSNSNKKDFISNCEKFSPMGDLLEENFYRVKLPFVQSQVAVDSFLNCQVSRTETASIHVSLAEGERWSFKG